MNGMRSDQSNVTLDGIGVNDQNNGYAFTSVLNVPPDSVEEFRVTTANANADSGYSSGAQVALVTKSGTNNFHGSAYEYNRNTIFSANDPFLKESQVSSGESNTAPKLLRNVFGATVGGPIKKNRLFFFANYEGRRDAQGTSVLRDVPSAALQSGVLEYLCQATRTAAWTRQIVPAARSTGCSGVQPGYYALGPTQITAMDPLGIGPSAAIESSPEPVPCVQRKCRRWFEHSGLSVFLQRGLELQHLHCRLDYHINASGSETLFWRGQTQNFKEPGLQQFPGQSAATTMLDDSKGIDRRTDLTHLLQAHQRFSLGLHPPGSDRTPVLLSIRECF